MSAITVARVESKIQSVILGPLWCCFLAGAFISTYYAAWLVAAAHVLLCFYIGWIGANLGIHHGKSFAQLKQGVRVVLPPLAPDETDDLSYEEMRPLVSTMVHALYSVILAQAVILLAVGTKFYWVILICVVSFYALLPFTGLVVRRMSINKLALRGRSDDDAGQTPSAKRASFSVS